MIDIEELAYSQGPIGIVYLYFDIIFVVNLLTVLQFLVSFFLFSC